MGQDHWIPEEAELSQLYFSALEWEEKALGLTGYMVDEGTDVLQYFDVNGDLAGIFHLVQNRGWLRL